MTFLKTLILASEISEVAYIKFLNQYKFDKPTLHLFFEGEDDKSFYINYIESLAPKKYTKFYYVCNGKDNVYQNHANINWTVYNKSRALFFTDKDFDDVLQIERTVDQNIFVTEFYSFENYIVNSFIMERFLREICNLNIESYISSVKDAFDIELKKFSENFLVISAWLIYVRKNKFPTNFNDIDLSNLFTIDDDLKFQRKKCSEYSSTYDYICKSTDTNHTFSYKDILLIAKQLRKINSSKVYIRGKFEAWFLFAFCKKVSKIVIEQIANQVKEFNRTSKKKVSKPTLHIELKLQNIIPILAPRVPIPDKVEKFIRHNINNIES